MKTKVIFFTFAFLLCHVLSSQENQEFCDNLDYNINMLICYGQSLSVGGGATNVESDFRNILSFPGGCNEWQSKVNLDDSESVDNFYGDDFVLLDSLSGKAWPPVAAIAVTWMNLLEEEDDINLDDFDNHFLLSTPGYSGVPIEKLLRGTDYYERLLMSVQKGNEFSMKRNKTFGVPSLFWVQGESNVPTDTEQQYYEKLDRVFKDLNKDIKAITGQEKDVVFITYQTSPVIGTVPYPSAGEPRTYEDCGPSFAQLQLAKKKENVYMGGAMYQYAYGDIWHPKDRAVVGVQLGIAAKRVISDQKAWKVFAPIQHKVTKKGEKWIVSIKFEVPVVPMRFDGTGGEFHNLNGKQKNFGFSLVNESGQDIITSEPYIEDGNTLVLECLENPENTRLNYALDGHYGGGNLCDSQNISIDNKSKDYVIDNFCPAFRDYRLLKN